MIDALVVEDLSFIEVLASVCYKCKATRAVQVVVPAWALMWPRTASVFKMPVNWLHEFAGQH